MVHRTPHHARTTDSTRKPVTAQILYAHLVKDLLSPAFRDLGFKGSGGHYSLPCSDCWALLGLQKSTHSDAAEVRFTINLKVVNKKAWEQQRQERTRLPERPQPSTFYGTWVAEERIGLLTPEKHDKWWKLSSARRMNAVTDEVIHDVREYGLPWMHQQMLNQDCRSAY